MTGDVAAYIGERHTGLFTEGRDQSLVEIVYSYPGEANEKEKIDEFSGLRVGELHTLRAYLFPRRDGLTDNTIYRLGESGAGLVDRNIEQANGVGRQHAICAGNGDILLLPTYAAYAQTNDLVTAKASKQPGDDKCSGHFNRICG